MVNAYNPVADPIGFILFFFIFGIGEDIIGTILKMAILSSVIAFPFALIGKRLFGWIGQSVKNRLAVLFLTSALTTFIFIIVIRLWYVLWGSVFFSAGAVQFILGFALAAIVAFAFVFLGDYLNHVIRSKWQVPEMLALYVIDLIVCLAFFIAVTLVMYGYTYTLQP